MKIDDVIHSVPAELADAIERYEISLMNNDTDTLSMLFADDPDGIPVARVDDDGVLFGHDAIAVFRERRRIAPSRILRSRTCRMLGERAAVTISIFDKSSGGTVLQTQIWQCFPNGWRIVAAHLTYPRSAIDSRVWRVVGTPLVRGARGTDSRLPLEGLKIAVKDLYGVAGQAIGAGSEAWLKEATPELRHSAPVRKLLEAGADVMGISRTDEFAYSIAGTNSHYGMPPNPAAPGRISGGSSSGSATATALGQVDIGLGSDTGGSVRVPSSYQHLWGIRTTHDLIGMEGVLPLAQSFDTVGWMTRDWHVLHRVAEVLISSDVTTPQLSGRILWSRELVDQAHPDVADAIHRWIGQLICAVEGGTTDFCLERRTLNNVLGPVADTAENHDAERLDAWFRTFKTVQGYEAWHNDGSWIESHWDTLGADVASRFREASTLTEREYQEAMDRMWFWRSNVCRLLGDDVLLVPSSAGVAPRIENAAINSAAVDAERSATMRLTCIAGLCGLPAVNIPLRTRKGLPCGVSVVGPAKSDASLIAFAGVLSEATLLS